MAEISSRESKKATKRHSSDGEGSNVPSRSKKAAMWLGAFMVAKFIAIPPEWRARREIRFRRLKSNSGGLPKQPGWRGRCRRPRLRPREFVRGSRACGARPHPTRPLKHARAEAKS